jgi:hypothetical protein
MWFKRYQIKGYQVVQAMQYLSNKLQMNYSSAMSMNEIQEVPFYAVAKCLLAN